MSARVLRALALLLVSAVLPFVPALAQSQSGFTYNGVVHTSWWWNEYNNFDSPTGVATDSRTQLLTTNANWVAVLVTQYQDTFNSNVIQARTTEMKTPTDDSLRFAIQELHAKGARVMLKPHVDLWNDSGHWRGQIVPTDVNAWFASYTTFIVHYAQLAQDQGVEGLVVGTELVMMTGSANQARWNAVIDAVRAVYSGTLAYAANATFPADEFTSVSFWDRVDLIGLDAYFTLTNHPDPTLAELTAAWTSNANGENIVAAIQNVSSAHTKPVIFTELGYKSVPGANQQPWNSSLFGNYDPTEQANCVDAAFGVWSTRTSFMKGIFWWAWPVPVPQANDLDYNPRNKPAEAVLRRWQGGGTATPGFSISASPASVTVNRGATGTSAVTVTRTGGFAASVAFTNSALPSGVTASFSPTSTTGATSTLTFSASSTAATGTTTVTVTGTGSGTPHTATIALTVAAPATPDFSLAASPTSLSVTRGASGADTVNITRLNGFTGSVGLAATGLPSGVTASFNPASASGNSSVLTLTASATATLGAATVTLTGTSGALVHTATIALTVTAAAVPDFSLSTSPTSLSVNQGATGTSTVTITRLNGFTGSVGLAAMGLPSGVTASFNPTSASGNSSVLTLTASATATLGAATVTVTGASGTLTHTTSIALTVSGTGTGTGTGGVTLTPVVSSNNQWFNQEEIQLSSTGTLTALSVTITIQRTGGITHSNQYNTVGGQITQSNSSTTAAITYQFALVAGQTLGSGTGRLFATQQSGSGTVHPTTGDLYTVTYTTGGVSYTQSGHF